MKFLKGIFGKKNRYTRDKSVDMYNTGRPEDDAAAFCQAPLKSLYLSPGGKITPCCYNRWDTLGNYNTQSLEKIWQDQPIKKLRKALKNYNPPSGCEVCAMDFHARQFHAVKALQYDGLPPACNQPLLLEFETDHTCNLACIMCSDKHEAAFKNKEAENSEQYGAPDVLFSQLKPWLNGLKEARFTGGEPFLSPFYLKIWDYLTAFNPKCVISVQTNGTVLTEQHKTLLKNGTFNISVSFDACSKDVYRQIRPPADFDKVIENIGFFRDYCISKNTHFSLAACPMRLNWKEMPGLMNFARSNHALLSFHTVWFPPALSLWNLDYSTLDHIYRYLDRFKWHAISDTEKKNVVQYRLLMAQVEQWAIMARAFENSFNPQEPTHFKELLLLKIQTWCSANITNSVKQKEKYDNYCQLINDISAGMSHVQMQSCFKEILKTPLNLIINILEYDNRKSIESYFRAYLEAVNQP